MTKSKLREKMIGVRKGFPDKERASQIIVNRVMQLPVWKKAHVVCVYRSLPNEVDTRKLVDNKIIIYPEHAGNQNIDLFIVPGVAFDKNGNRLGRGRGFYDRLMTGSSVAKIGLAFDVQVIAQVPHSSYDVPMTMVITEKAIYETKTS